MLVIGCWKNASVLVWVKVVNNFANGSPKAIDFFVFQETFQNKIAILMELPSLRNYLLDSFQYLQNSLEYHDNNEMFDLYIYLLFLLVLGQEFPCFNFSLQQKICLLILFYTRKAKLWSAEWKRHVRMVSQMRKTKDKNLDKQWSPGQIYHLWTLVRVVYSMLRDLYTLSFYGNV